MKCGRRATLCHQAILPHCLNDRFKTVPEGDATKRLFNPTSNLNSKETPIEGRKPVLIGGPAAGRFGRPRHASPRE